MHLILGSHMELFWVLIFLDFKLFFFHKMVSHKCPLIFVEVSKLVHKSFNHIHYNVLLIVSIFQASSLFFSTNFTCGTTHWTFNSSNFMNIPNQFYYISKPCSWNFHLAQIFVPKLLHSKVRWWWHIILIDINI